MQTKGLTVPNLVAGGYHLILRTDVDDTVFEASEANNERAIPVAITTPDLVPIALAAPAAATTQQAITVSWTVKNQGTAATARTWTDNLYLAPTSSCCAGAILLGQWTWSTSVAAGGTYTQTKSVILPGVPAGGYQLILQADAGDRAPRDAGRQQSARGRDRGHDAGPDPDGPDRAGRRGGRARRLAVVDRPEPGHGLGERSMGGQGLRLGEPDLLRGHHQPGLVGSARRPRRRSELCADEERDASPARRRHVLPHGVDGCRRSDPRGQ